MNSSEEYCRHQAQKLIEELQHELANERAANEMWKQILPKPHIVAKGKSINHAKLSLYFDLTVDRDAWERFIRGIK